MTQGQISEFQENLKFCEASERLEQQNLIDRAKRVTATIITRSKSKNFVNRVSKKAEFEEAKINQDNIKFDLKTINDQIASANRVIYKVDNFPDKENYYAVSFLYEQRRDLLSEIARNLKTIEPLFKKECYSSFESIKRKNIASKRNDYEIILAYNVKEFDDWVRNQRLINGEDCLLTQVIEFKYFKRSYDA